MLSLPELFTVVLGLCVLDLMDLIGPIGGPTYEISQINVSVLTCKSGI